MISCLDDFVVKLLFDIVVASVDVVRSDFAELFDSSGI